MKKFQKSSFIVPLTGQLFHPKSKIMKKLFTFLIIAILAIQGYSQTTIVWKGITWDVLNGTAAVDGSGNLVLTADGTGQAIVHVNQIATLAGAATPWIQLSYMDVTTAGQIEMLMEDETAPYTRFSCGSMWSKGEVLAMRYTVPTHETYLFWDEARQNIERTVYVGKRASGTLDVNFDGKKRSSAYLNQTSGGSWEYADVYLRLRGAAPAATVTFTNLTYGIDHANQNPTEFLVTKDDLGVVMSLKKAVDESATGDVVNVASGTYVEGATINLDKAISIIGATSPTRPVIQTAGAAELFDISAGATIKNLDITKTDKTTQAIMRVRASNIIIDNCKVHGQFIIGEPEGSRAMVFNAGSFSGIQISNNEFYSLRQPAYISGTNTGIISNNLTYGTKGWVIEGGNLTFTGNTWGVGVQANVFDIAIIALCPTTYYTDIVAMSAANNGAVIEDQRGTALLSVVYVDKNSTYPDHLGSLLAPYLTIAEALPRAVAGGSIYVAEGTYGEVVNVNKSVKLYGAQANVTPVLGGRTGGETIIKGGDAAGIGPLYSWNQINISADDVEVNGFECETRYYGIATNNNATGTHSNVKIKYNYVHPNSFAGSNYVGIVTAVNVSSYTPPTPAVVFNNYEISHNLITSVGAKAIAPSGAATYNSLNISYNDISCSGSNGRGIFAGGGPAVTQFNDAVITYNNLHDIADLGINMVNLVDADISHNTFTNVLAGAYLVMRGGTITYNTISGLTGSYYGLKLTSDPTWKIPVSMNVEIANNSITYNENALVPNTVGLLVNVGSDGTTQVVDAASLNVHDNSFINAGAGPSTGSYAINNLASTTLPATCNWFGTADPTEVTAAISGDVTYAPFSISEGGACTGVLPIVTNISTPASTTCGNYDIPVTVQNFNDVANISLKLKLLNPALHYIDITPNPAFSGLMVANVNLSGDLFSLSYSDVGITLPYDAVLFTIHFDLLPAASEGNANLEWDIQYAHCQYSSPLTDVYEANFNNLSWTLPIRAVKNTRTSLEYCTIQAAINDGATHNSDEITVDALLYNASEQVLVNKEVTIKGINGQPTVDFLGTVTAKPTLFDISANNVTIENIHFNVDQSKLRSAIIASAAGIDNITIKNNLFDPYGTTAGSWGDRNAVSINYAGYRNATAGVDNILFSGNVVNSTATNVFRAGVAVDEGGGTFSGNTLKSGGHDILVRFGSNGPVNITNNAFNGGGVELADQNAAAGTFTISGNTFTGGASDPTVALLRIKDNYNSIPHIVSLNVFNYVDWAVSLENMNSITLNGNTFLSTVTTAHAVVVNTKSITSISSDIVQVPIGAIFTNNNFNGIGTALTFQNHDSENDTYGTITIGTAGNENNFAATLSSFIMLDGQTGSSDLSTTFPNYPVIIGTGGTKTTTMACWDQNLNAQNNNFDVGAGSQLPSAMSFAELFALEDKIDHKIDNQSLGFVLVKASNVYVTDVAAPAANNNDYTRIRNAVELVANNWTINLHGTFEWTETNAAASWALGNDGILSPADDYAIYVPANLNGITFTAPEGLGNATINGPGDLPNANLEGVLAFDGGDNKNWTISNMEFLEFDMPIYMGNGAGGTDAFEGTTITNNIFNIANDLNSTVAPADPNQNIGIHFSFGVNQTISNNTFNVPGDGISDGTNYSTIIVMQSNTSGGAAYDGLKIKDNTINVLGVPDPTNPAVIRGIWENGHNSNAAIEISGNLFTNLDPANTADKNRQFAFWVTSVSNASKKVEYKNNEVSGFNEGVAWMGGDYTGYTPPAYLTGQLPVEIMNNKFYGMKNAVVVRKDAASTNPESPAYIKNNSFTNAVTGGLSIKNEGTGDAVSTCNWFGTTVPTAIAALISGTVTYTPWLYDETDSDLATRGFQPLVTCDETLPVITCPGEFTSGVNTDDTFIGVIGIATATDLPNDAGTVTISKDHAVGFAYPIGTTVVTWTARDLAGNTSTCTQNVIVTANTLSGTLMYNNAANTGMNEVVLKLSDAAGNPVTHPDGTPVIDVTTATVSNKGDYTFSNLRAGTYAVSVVTNDNFVEYINSTDAGAVNLWSSINTEIEYVKFLAGDVAGDVPNIPNFFINGTDALRIQQYFVNGTPFDREKWSYWEKGVKIDDNFMDPKPDNFNVVVSGGDVQHFDIYAMVTGDFKGDYDGSYLKSASVPLSLVPNSQMNVIADQEFELPLYAGSSMEVGAVSMILEIPASLVEVQDIKVNGSNDPVSWAVKGNELRIGWYSLTPVNVAEKSSLLTLKLKASKSFNAGQSFDLVLKNSPLNELADRNFDVINGATILVAKVGNGLEVTNINDKLDSQGLSLSNYPNPFKSWTTVAYTLPVNGKVSITLYNSIGQTVTSLVNGDQNAGQYSIRFDGSRLQPGIYIAKLRLINTNTEINGTMKLSIMK